MKGQQTSVDLTNSNLEESLTHQSPPVNIISHCSANARRRVSHLQDEIRSTLAGYEVDSCTIQQPTWYGLRAYEGW